MKLFNRKLLWLFAIGFPAITGSSAYAEKAVAVISSDGTSHEVLLSDLSRIEVGEEGITLVTSGSGDRSFDYSEIDRILISAEWTGVKEVITPEDIAVWPAKFSDCINIGGIRPGANITIYDLSGKAVASASATEEFTTIDTKELPSGIYVVSTGEKSTRVIK